MNENLKKTSKCYFCGRTPQKTKFTEKVTSTVWQSELAFPGTEEDNYPLPFYCDECGRENWFLRDLCIEEDELRISELPFTEFCKIMDREITIYKKKK